MILLHLFEKKEDMYIFGNYLLSVLCILIATSEFSGAKQNNTFIVEGKTNKKKRRSRRRTRQNKNRRTHTYRMSQSEAERERESRILTCIFLFLLSFCSGRHFIFIFWSSDQSTSNGWLFHIFMASHFRIGLVLFFFLSGSIHINMYR